LTRASTESDVRRRDVDGRVKPSHDEPRERDAAQPEI
jgi:hypothetical protein